MKRARAADRARSDRASLLLPRSRWALGGMAAAIVNAAMRVAIVPVFVTPVFDRVLASDDLTALPWILAAAAAVAVAGSLALWAQDALLGRAAAEAAAHWRRTLYRRLLRRPAGTLPGTSGGLASRILTDLREIETWYQHGLGTLVAETATVVGVLALLFAQNALAASLLVVFGVPGFFVLRYMGARLERAADRSQAGMESLGRLLQEGFRHHETVRAFAADEHMLARLDPVNRQTARDMRRRSFLAGGQTPLAQVLVFVALGLLVVVLATAVQNGTMSSGDVVSFLILVALLSTPLQLLPRGYAMLLQATAAKHRILALHDRPAEAEVQEEDVGPRQRGEPATDARPRLALRGVRFAYGGQTVLQGIDLDFPDTGLFAIAGPSGAGKTTLLRLLLGFASPAEGEVVAFGRPMDAVGEAELRARIAYVPQEHALLSGTLRDNVALGRELSDSAIWNAMRAAGVAHVVTALPQGLDTVLREDGEGLSGGERQRIAVARALAGDPDILLLDEPTSNLDEDSEAALVEVLDAEAQRRLVIAVAHRPALAEAADAVLSLRDGQAKLHRRGAAERRGEAPPPSPARAGPGDRGDR